MCNRLSQLGHNEGLNLLLILDNLILPFMVPTFMVPEIQNFIILTTFSSHAQQIASRLTFEPPTTGAKD